jgi:pyruvate/2-oxoglutarate/acetoin dehydrogenase E1 component/TPP-dependent pyruvate/acetoin dehydrogenase alpha subunit
MAKNTLLNPKSKSKKDLSVDKSSILRDFEICCISREVSILGRKAVLSGRGKFGIFGAGKEVPQVALANAFKKGDFRSGYYRDQTFMLAKGLATVDQLFAQLYADPKNDPFSGGRQMNSHFATPLIDKEGNWLNHLESANVSADVSSTAGQMARALGLANASKKYRSNKEISTSTAFSDNGNEVSFCTIGDASTSEGVFWETINAAGVMQVPLLISVWDDGYGISVPIKYQTTKSSISEVVGGFSYDEAKEQGIEIFTCKAWDYPGLIELYQKVTDFVRKNHRPALIHIDDVTQPQGHSTSGSHERYKTEERLNWEVEKDCILLMEEWIIKSKIATAKETLAIRQSAKEQVKLSQRNAWNKSNIPVKEGKEKLANIYNNLPAYNEETESIKKELSRLHNPELSELIQNARHMRYALFNIDNPQIEALENWIVAVEAKGAQHYHTNLYSDSDKSALKVPVVPPEFSEDSPVKNGYLILNDFFHLTFEANPEVYAFGEDVGQIGDVNQGMVGLQDKYSIDRVFDSGIRENTIVGQAIGMSMRGLRPIAKIQYLDYLVYGLQPLTDDLATVRYRSNGLQHAPAIIRTRGHRLEGIWHSGSPMGMILGSLRGVYVLVPRNMTQAAGFYNTMLQSDDPALIIECLNGYRLKEKRPDNLKEFTVPLGVPEVLKEGSDVTLVTYGSCVRVAQKGIELLENRGISVELIDVQSLLPFDIEHRIVESLKKTNKIVFMDEDVPGGGSAYMMREVLEVQGGYKHLDSAPVCLTAAEHRPPYGSTGDYFSKPNPENVFEIVYRIMAEEDPQRFNYKKL